MITTSRKTVCECGNITYHESLDKRRRFVWECVTCEARTPRQVKFHGVIVRSLDEMDALLAMTTLTPAQTGQMKNLKSVAGRMSVAVDGRTARALVRKGLVTEGTWEGTYDLTAKGERVAASLNTTVIICGGY